MAASTPAGMPSLGSRWRLKLSITWRLFWLKAGRRGMSHLVRKVGTLASVSRPAPASPERASKVAVSMARRPPEIFCQYTRPCGVSCTPRPFFCSSSRPRKASSPAICLLTALTVMHRAPAASVMLWWRATASKASSSWMVGQSRFMHGLAS